MSIATKSVYQMVDGVLDEGLPFVALNLERLLDCSIIILDNDGQVHYPDIGQEFSSISDIFVQFPVLIAGNEYYYQRTDGLLFYCIKYNGECAYVVVENLPEHLVSQAVSILRKAKLAIKCYFTKINKNKARFEKELTEYLFLRKDADIRDIIRLSERDLDIDRPCFISLIEVEEMNQEEDLQLLRSYTCEYLKKEKVEVFPASWANFLALIIPARFKKYSQEIDLNWPRLVGNIRYKNFIENKFAIKTSYGIGQIYPLFDIHRSYNEARIALTLPRLMGKSNFIQHFSELGIYYSVFSQDIADVKNFCLKTLGKLIEYDDKTNGELLPTLRKLLDSGVNMKSTASSLFIHVNTLYYRLDKIGQILNADLSEMDTRVNLYIAIKVYDTLMANGFLD